MRLLILFHIFPLHRDDPVGHETMGYITEYLPICKGMHLRHLLNMLKSIFPPCRDEPVINNIFVCELYLFPIGIN